MARRPREQLQVSLFPFMSILCCVIGVLVLLIVGVALSQMDTQDVEALERAQKAQQIDAYNQQYQVAIASLAAQLEAAEKARREFELARQALEAMKKEQKELEKRKTDANLRKQDQVQSVKVLAKIKELQDLNKEIKPEIKTLNEEIAKLKAELAKRKEPPKEAAVQIRPGGTGSNQDPTFVEVTRSGLIIYKNRGAERIRVRGSEVEKDKEFEALLDQAYNDKKKTVVFLIREDASGMYGRANRYARTLGVAAGKLPVIGKGKVDLSVFYNK